MNPDPEGWWCLASAHESFSKLHVESGSADITLPISPRCRSCEKLPAHHQKGFLVCFSLWSPDKDHQ
ncbi:mCG1028561 [Mus musculus]|nr:mCG1028561 [Mus musculus]